MKKFLILSALFIFCLVAHNGNAQCSCQGNNVVYYQVPQTYVPQQYYYPAPSTFQQTPVQYSPYANSGSGYSNQGYYVEPSYKQRGQGFQNTLGDIERIVNILGQSVNIYQQVRGSGGRSRQSYSQQQNIQPAQNIVYYQ